MDTNTEQRDHQPREARGGSGCTRLLVYGFAAGWIVLSTLGAQFFSWLVDELQFEGGPDWVHLLRIVISVAYGLLVFFPMLILARNWNRDPDRAFFRAWGWAGLFALVLSIRGIAGLADSQLANFLQILGTLVFLGIMFFRLRRQPQAILPSGSGITIWPIVLLGGAILAFPWMAWGALGSILDILLNLTAGLLFGLAAVLIFRSTWGDRLFPENDGGFRDYLGLGLVGALTLLIMATGFGTVGLQVIMAIVLAPLGLTTAALYLLHRSHGSGVSWNALAIFIGMAAAYPLLFLDPDELALIIGLGPGEVIDWALRISIVSGILNLFLCLAIFLLRFRLSRTPKTAFAIGAGAAWIAAFILYLMIGQPGLFGERLFVILRDQADVSSAASIVDLDERRAFVYESLVEHARSTQAGLRENMDRFGIDYTPYYLVNGLEVNGGPLVRIWLSALPEVDRVLASPSLRPLPEPVPAAEGDQPAPDGIPWNMSIISADRVWGELGVTGGGVVIGQSDSGVQGDHPELADSYRGRDQGDDYNWFDPWNHTTSPVDIGGHGTHTLGSALGNSVGIAPDADWFGCVNLARNLGNPAYYLDCMQYMLAPFPQEGSAFDDGDPLRAADVINNSWGCPEIEGCDANALRPGVEALRLAGIFVVASAGNEGMIGCGTINDPLAIYDGAYTVGAIDPLGDLALFSSIGPVLVDGSGRVKPDIAAPGVGILSSFPGSTYSILEGTSMAGPHVAGVVALIWSANPDLMGDIERTEEILNQTASDYTGATPQCIQRGEVPNNAVGWGVVDAYNAVRLALEE